MFRRSIKWFCILVAVVSATISITESSTVNHEPKVKVAAAVDLEPPVGSSRTQRSSRLATEAPPPTADCRSPPPGDAAVSLLQNLSAVEKGGRLIQAAKNGSVEEVQALLAAGVDVGWRDADLNYTALHWAAFWGHAGVVRCLLEGAAEVGARNNYQATPLHFAAGSGHAAVARLLVAHSADPNAADDEGQTPLHWAAEQGFAEAAAALLQAGADRAARDVHGRTPQDLARHNNYQELADALSST